MGALRVCGEHLGNLDNFSPIDDDYHNIKLC